MLLLFMSAEAQTARSGANSASFRAPFRYVIVNEALTPAASRKDAASRYVEVLLDEKSFSGENLTALFKLVSKRYPKPEALHVNVFTNLEDIETPEEREQPKMSEIKTSENRAESAPNPGNRAVFTRTKEKSFFYMYFANGDFREIEVK